MRSGLSAGRLVGLARRAMGLLRDVSRSGRGDDTEGDRRDRSAGGRTSGRSTSAPTGGRRRSDRTDRTDRAGGRPSGTRPSAPTGSTGSTRATGSTAASTDSELRGTTFVYSPSLDGDADPGEVVWTWVPYEDDPSQGKDRPVVLVGRRSNGVLVGVALTSKRHDHEPQLDVGTGPWDREGRPSYAKLERVLDVDPARVRREGAVLAKARFDDLVAALRRVHGLTR